MDAESPQLPAWIVLIAGIGLAMFFAGALALNLLSDPISPLGVVASLLPLAIGIWVTIQMIRRRKAA